jgi:type IV pilus assembly protein PilA
MRNTSKHGVRRPGKASSMGFTLIELLVVVAIILIIAAIAIPNFLKARISANEASAASAIHAINTSEIAYSSNNPTIGFSALLADLGPAGGGYLDSSLSSGTKGGYTFTYVQTPGGAGAPATAYTLNADPISRSFTGQRSFYSDQTNVTHYDPLAPATAASLALQ